MYRNLVLSGGAFKATAFIGCIRYLEEKGICNDIINIIGSSAGAIVALLLGVGFNSREMEDFIIKELQKFQDHEIDLENVLDIFYTLGIDNGESHVQVFQRILLFKGYDPEITFLNLIKATGKNIVICGSNLTTASVEYFSVDSSPNMKVIDAIRISISIPLLITPVEYNNSLYFYASLFDIFQTG